ncbi:MAG: hypothetical protein IJ504_06535 [Bacteroidales bacterium]|nr:hypothetical protein [Bacteroidales bacterium]
MTQKTKTILKKVLAYCLMSITLMLIYFVIAFVIDLIFNLFGGEDGVSILSTIATCIFLTVIFVVGDIINSRKKGVDRSDEIIRICRRVLTTTTVMFCGSLVIEWLIQKFSDEDFSLGMVHWLSFALAVALFDELIKKNNEKKIQEDENALVVAAECEDMQTAEDICSRLENNGIKAMVIEKDSPVYIKGNSSHVQIQVCRKDLLKAEEVIK